MEEELKKDMTPKLIGETWRKYPTETSKQKATYGLFECQYCGEEFECITNSVNIGNTKSCGCQRGRWFKHGLESHRFYSTWHNMIQRCTNPNHKAYKNYGGRGITVCEEWLDVATFIAWAESTYPNIEDATLDRIDNDKGYSPDNCRWADRSTQSINQRMKSNNTSGYTGVTWHKNRNRWCSAIRSQGVIINVGTFKDKMEAVQARDNYIIENNLPHKLSTDYKEEN